MKNFTIVTVLLLTSFCFVQGISAQEFSLETDNEYYELGSSVKISGTTSADNVIIQIQDPQDETILIRSIEVKSGSYSLDFNVPTYSSLGTYEIVVSTLIDEIPNISTITISVIPQAKIIESPQKQEFEEKTSSEGGGCLIATAAYGSEMAPQVQFLREIRDGKVMATQSGTAFMTGFNQFYYSFSPAVADLERDIPVFKEAVKLALTPMLTSLTLLNIVDVDTEEKMLGWGVSLILLNIGMYFVAPAILIIKIRKMAAKFTKIQHMRIN